MSVNVPQILVVDDSTIVRHLVRQALVDAHYDVWTAASGEEALDLIRKKGLPHLAVVDINMPPGMNGFEFCRRVHAYSDLPIIMLSVEAEEETIADGLDRYAEDYMVKLESGPVRGTELVSRTRRVLRRQGDFAYTLAPIISVDERLQVDIPNRMAYVDGEEIRLSPTETKLLYVLIRHAGRTLSNEFLIGRMWPLEEVYEDRLHKNVYRLRRKLEADRTTPHYIVSDWGRGYLFPAPQENRGETGAVRQAAARS